jgi:hypothetical protein
MSNSRRWKEFITWWNSVKKDIADEGTILMIDEKIASICRGDKTCQKYRDKANLIICAIDNGDILEKEGYEQDTY